MRSYFKTGFPLLCACIIASVFLTGCGGGNDTSTRKPFIRETGILIPADTYFGSSIAFPINPTGIYENKEAVIETVNVFFSNRGLTSPDDTVLRCKLNGDINGGQDEDIDLPPFSPSFTANLQAIGGHTSGFAAIYPIRMHVCPGCLVTFRCDTNSADEMRASITFLGYLISPDSTTP